MTIEEVMRLAREAAHKRATPANWHGLEAALQALVAQARDEALKIHQGLHEALGGQEEELEALRAEVGGLRHALSRALVEMRHANDVMLREAGVGVIDINTISLARAALQEPTP